MRKYIVYIGVLLLTLGGCGDFLEEQSEDLTYAINCADLEELLVGGGYATRRGEKTGVTLNVKSATSGDYFPWLHVMDDDVTELVEGAEPSSSSGDSRKKLGAYYRWDKDPCHDGDAFYSDPSWIALYTHIGVTNAVLDKVEVFTDDAEADRNRVKGQALFLRAYYYFYLVNFYGKPYSDITSAEDPGVPLKTFAYIDDRYWGRATVKEVYDQIVSDLIGAIRCLEDVTPKSYYWIGPNAARLLLSRVYCYMGKWELVPGLCDTIMQQNYMLFDAIVNATKDRTSEVSLVFKGSPEIIFTMGSNNRGTIFSSNTGSLSLFKVTDELYDLYDIGDYRRDLLFQSSKSGNISPRYDGAKRADDPKNPTGPTTYFGPDGNISDIFTFRLPEAYLNLAEALAMTGDEARARTILQELREKRIAPEAVGTVTESGEELIEFIREERRRELCFEGHRWLDLRRYAVCPNYPSSKEIKHNHYVHGVSGSGIYEGYYLLPGYPDNKWVLPIPNFEIEENQGEMKNNERDESSLY